MVRQAHHEREQAHHERILVHHERILVHHERMVVFSAHPELAEGSTWAQDVDL